MWSEASRIPAPELVASHHAGVRFPQQGQELLHSQGAPGRPLLARAHVRHRPYAVQAHVQHGRQAARAALDGCVRHAQRLRVPGHPVPGICAHPGVGFRVLGLGFLDAGLEHAVMWEHDVQ